MFVFSFRVTAFFSFCCMILSYFTV